jgi:hypothetical protein
MRDRRAVLSYLAQRACITFDKRPQLVLWRLVGGVGCRSRRARTPRSVCDAGALFCSPGAHRCRLLLVLVTCWRPPFSRSLSPPGMLHLCALRRVSSTPPVSTRTPTSFHGRRPLRQTAAVSALRRPSVQPGHGMQAIAGPSRPPAGHLTELLAPRARVGSWTCRPWPRRRLRPHRRRRAHSFATRRGQAGASTCSWSSRTTAAGMTWAGTTR